MVACAEDRQEENVTETKTSAALLIIDIINPLDFEGAAPLQRATEVIVAPIAGLRDAADAAAMPVVYVNDNYGAWHTDSSEVIRRVAESDTPGKTIAERLRPRDKDYFVIKPQISGFYATTLAALLPRLGVDRLILAGVAADICVLFTAADAHMREYDLWVPSDAVASEADERARWALEIMSNSLGAETRSTRDLSIADWLAAT
jgi:nicotinamidase-related amidase